MNEREAVTALRKSRKGLPTPEQVKDIAIDMRVIVKTATMSATARRRLHALLDRLHPPLALKAIERANAAAYHGDIDGDFNY